MSAGAATGGSGTAENIETVEGHIRVNEFFDAMSGTQNIIRQAIRGQKIIVKKDGTKLHVKRIIRIKREYTSRAVGADYYSPPKFTIVYESGDTGEIQEIARFDMIDIYPLPAKGGARRRTHRRRHHKRKTHRRHH
jgi:hypothetical protein